MEPKTKLQHQVVKLFDQRPPLSKSKETWGKKRLFKRYYFETKKNFTCMECGHRWDKKESIKGKYCQCPKCNLSLIKWKYSSRTDSSSKMFMVIEHIKGFQVARYFIVSKHMKVLQPALYTITEVINQWLTPDGKIISFARLVSGFYSRSGWSEGSPFVLRKANNYYYNCICYPAKYIHPHVYRNGYDGSDHGFHIMYLSKILLAYPAAETMLKTGKWDLFDKFNRYEQQFKKYWPYMVIAWRHGYNIEEDLQFWFDHMDLLTFFKKDRRNPKFICSPNMMKEHIQMSKKRTKMWEEQKAQRERNRKENELRKAEAKKKAFEKEYSKYFDLTIPVDQNTEIVVLKDLDDFIDEAKALHHCVDGYFGKQNSLILSTRHKGKRIETIQFDLVDMKISQARGACNKDSKYHNQILKTMNSNIHLIKQLAV